jgi:hypothetical protein
MASDLLVIVPTRGRPASARRVVEAWKATEAFEAAELMFAADLDDPSIDDYVGIPQDYAGLPITVHISPKWRPMVAKLNDVAGLYARSYEYPVLGFAGDDHLPRTKHWAAMLLAALDQLRTGIVYGNDLLQGERLCTSWAMTSDIVRALGRMVPAPVDHMYCDNSVMDLGRLAGCLRYLPEVVVEHCHPLAGKAEWDTGYARVNRAEQFQRDEAAYRQWCGSGRDADVATIKSLATES